MKIKINLILFGSPARDSFTGKLLKKSTDINNNDKFYYCFNSPAKPCDGCKRCIINGHCKYTDLDTFYRDFEAADSIIIAFPVYNASVPAPLKAYIDRLQVYFNLHFSGQKKFEKKRPVTVIMTEGSKNDVTDTVLRQLLPVFTITGCKLKKCITLSGTDFENPLLSETDF